MTANNLTSNNVSFVIPAFNEELNIEATLRSVLEFQTEFDPAHVTVVDNMSTDRTADIATSLGVHVITRGEGTIGSLRNFGAIQTNTSILVFLDADVTLTAAWHERFTSLIKRLLENPLMITGSHCSIPDNSKFLQKHWFSAIEHSSSSHLGTGHMIVTRQLFDSLQGFSEQLETGEDYDFCQRAIKTGGIIIEDPLLKVYHNDFPSDVVEFVAREAWHGQGDVQSIRTAVSSRVFLASILFLAAVVILITSLFQANWQFSAIVLYCILAYLLLLSYLKFRGRPLCSILANAGIFALYLVGRLLALPLRLRKVLNRRG